MRLVSCAVRRKRQKIIMATMTRNTTAMTIHEFTVFIPKSSVVSAAGKTPLDAAVVRFLAIETAVGLAVGEVVGLAVGEAAVGLAVGEAVGLAVGEAVGLAVGEAVGLAVGEAVGLAVGEAVGLAVGEAVGLVVCGKDVVMVRVNTVEHSLLDTVFA
jgi:hypothetical protein